MVEPSGKVAVRGVPTGGAGVTIGVMMAGGGVITGGVPIGGAGVIGMSLSESMLAGLHCKTHVYVQYMWPYTEILN